MNLRVSSLCVAASLVLVVACGDDKDDNLECPACVTGASCDVALGRDACVCPAGFTGDGKVGGSGCSALDNGGGDSDGGDSDGGDGDGDGDAPVDECAAGTADCVASATCGDTADAFTCSCAAGFAGDGRTSGTGCTNIDECATATADCVPTTATCADTDGGFTCTCATGYTGDGRTSGTGCVDNDECALGTDTCDAYASCANTAGSFTCVGFYGSSPFRNVFYRLENLTVAPATTPAWNTLSTIALTPSQDGEITGINGLANDPTTGLLYAIVKQTGITGRTLCTVEPTTGACTVIGNLGDNFASIAFRNDGQLFGVTGDGATVRETLYTIDKLTAVPTLAVALGNGSDGEVIQFNPDDGLIYHWSGSNVVYETVLADPPYTVTGIATSGAPASTEVFGAFWDANTASFITSNIASRVQRYTPAGVVGAAEGVAFLDDLRGLGTGGVLPHRITPATGLLVGGETVTLEGVGFTLYGPSPTVNFAGVAGTDVVVVDDTHITVVTPAGVAAGAVDVAIRSGFFGSTWPAGFTYE